MKTPRRRAVAGVPAEFFLIRNLRDLLACHAVVVLVKAGAIPAVQPSSKLRALLERKLSIGFSGAI